MDKLTDIFKEIKERISNPLIASFIISWLIINWKVPLTLVFYKIDELKLDGYKSYIQLINDNINQYTGIWWPLVGAIVYTFLFSWIRMNVIAFTTFIRTKSTTWNLEISKSGVIPVPKYIKLRESTEALEKTLINLINSESTLFIANNELTMEVANLKDEETKTKSEIDNLTGTIKRQSESQSVKTIDGYWNYYFQMGGHFTELKLFVDNGTIYRESNNAPKERMADISRFYHNFETKEMMLIKINTNYQSYESKIQQLNYTDDTSLLFGTEDQNPGHFIVYSRRYLTKQELLDIKKLSNPNQSSN